MKFNLDKSELTDAINVVSKAVKSKTTMPILECIHIVATGTTLVFEATNMDFSIRTEVSCISETGSVCVEAKQLTSVVKKMPAGEINIEVDEAYNVIISHGKKIKISIPAQNADAFPVIREEDGEVLKMDASVLKEAINGVAFCTDADNANKMMSGINIRTSGDIIRFCGIDGHRIGIRNTKIAVAAANDCDIIVPTEYLQEITKILPDTCVEITVNKLNVMFKTDSIVMTTRLIEGQYFKVETMISKSDAKASVLLSRNDLYETVDRAALVLSNGCKRPVIFELNQNDDMHVSSKSEVGEVEENITFQEKKGENIKIGFNPKLILDMLHAIPDNDVDIQFFGPKAPAIIKAQDESYLYLLLPVNILA